MYGNGGFGWIWFLWIGVVFLMFSSFGNWGYTYRLHRRLPGVPRGALDILDERYARGEIDRNEYGRMKAEITRAPPVTTGQ
jgi:putative membrane protein